ncbi:hypothetical protein BLM37_04550 [Candidatus Gracilibacteria bacterium GN02-873]|nr:hypothetical protein BLM37_04550 [Candidatus Gracilibacteria bacterium GN02-873]
MQINLIFSKIIYNTERRLSGQHPRAEGRKAFRLEPSKVATLCKKIKLSNAFGGTFQNTEPKHGFFRAFLFCNNPHYDSFGNTKSST